MTSLMCFKLLKSGDYVLLFSEFLFAIVSGSMLALPVDASGHAPVATMWELFFIIPTLFIVISPVARFVQPQSFTWFGAILSCMFMAVYLLVVYQLIALLCV